MKKYQENLKVENGKVYSYNTHVGTIERSTLIILGYWSKTTSKHLNYVAQELRLTTVTQ